MDVRFRPKGFRQGVQIAFLHGKQPDVPAGTGTTIIPIASPYRKCFILRLSLSHEQGIAGTSCTLAVLKENASGNVATLSNTVNLMAGVFFSGQVSGDLGGLLGNASTPIVTEAHRLLNEGDRLYAQLVTNAVSSGLVGIIVVAEVAVLE